MEDPLQLFKTVTWVSGATSVGLLLLLLLLTRWRAHWTRLLAWEEAFWSRLGVGSGTIRRLRRFEDSRGAAILICVLLVLHLALCASAIGAWAYFEPRVRAQRNKRLPVVLSGPTAPSSRTPVVRRVGPAPVTNLPAGQKVLPAARPPAVPAQGRLPVATNATAAQKGRPTTGQTVPIAPARGALGQTNPTAAPKNPVQPTRRK